MCIRDSFYNDGGEFVYVGKDQMAKAKELIHQMFPGNRRMPFTVKNRQYVLQGQHVKHEDFEISPVDFSSMPDAGGDTVDLREKKAPPAARKPKQKAATPKAIPRIPIE